MELLCPIALEEVVVREGLDTSGLTYGQATALSGVIVNEVMPVLGDMAGDRSCWQFLRLYPETITEYAAFPVLVIRSEPFEIEPLVALRRKAMKLCVSGRKDIPA
ncbi:hypothetical protein D9M69_432020 [compost metagenome]